MFDDVLKDDVSIMFDDVVSMICCCDTSYL